MASAVLLGMGTAFYDSDYSATVADVASGKTFFGHGSTEQQTGTMPVNGTINKQLAINETYNIPAGKTDGISITQNILTLAGQTVVPGKDMITVPSSGKVMTGNVTVNAVDNLKPENIKKGAVVGGVTGTWEGYVD